MIIIMKPKQGMKVVTSRKRQSLSLSNLLFLPTSLQPFMHSKITELGFKGHKGTNI
jgi:hypothetical protein